ncbi:hypothetical protein D3C81_787660 [compost metagenome]
MNNSFVEAKRGCDAAAMRRGADRSRGEPQCAAGLAGVVLAGINTLRFTPTPAAKAGWECGTT